MQYKKNSLFLGVSFFSALLLFAVASTFFVFTHNVFAESDDAPGAGREVVTDDAPGKGKEPEPQTTIDFKKLKNPLGAVDDLPSLVKQLVNIVLLIGIPIVALAIIYSGFLFVTAQGNETKLKTAKETFLYTMIGAAIILGAYVIANAIGGTINELRGENATAYQSFSQNTHV